LVGEIGSRTSLRYAAQLLTPAIVVAKTQGREGQVTKEDVETVNELFNDAKKSAKLLQQHAEKYLYQ
jgi:RuvB-like protein 1 (pontin 52)